MHACMHTYIHTYICMYVCVCIYIYIYIYTYVRTYVRTYVCTYVRMYVYIHIVNNIPHGHALFRRIMVQSCDTWYAVRTVEHVIYNTCDHWGSSLHALTSDLCAGAERARARPPPGEKTGWPAHGRVLSLT